MYVYYVLTMRQCGLCSYLIFPDGNICFIDKKRVQRLKGKKKKTKNLPKITQL